MPRAPVEMDEATPQRWDRHKWISVFSSHSPTIREVTECLGLGLSATSSNTNRGIPKFDNPDYRKLSNEVTRISKELPKDRDALLDFAANPHSLDQELDELLGTLGPAIWGRDADRSRLVKPDPSKKTYSRDLFYEEPEDRELLKIHVHRWIVIKACYYIRNLKLKRPSVPGEYDTVADIDAAGALQSPKSQLVSPDDTPKSGTPPTQLPTTLAAAPINERKRKSGPYLSVSDGEDNAIGSTPAKKRPYASATMPIQRKSPRKSLASIGLTENTPPNLPEGTPLQPRPVNIVPAAPIVAAPSPATTTPASESARPLLSPLSSNALNGVARPPSNASSGFTAVNAPNANGSTPRNYSSPYNASSAPTAPGVSNGAHMPLPSTGSNEPPTRNSPVTQTTPPVSLAPRPSSTSDGQSFHSHSIPHAPSASSSRGTPPVHSTVTTSHSRSVHTPPNGHHIERRNGSTPSVEAGELKMLQFDLCNSLLEYFRSPSRSSTDEVILLQKIETLWSRNAQSFQQQMGHLYDIQGKVLHAWIEERRKIGELRHSMSAQPGVPPAQMIERLLAMNDLRTMRLKWKALITQDGHLRLSPEDLLCKTFATMTETVGTEEFFRNELDRLNESNFEFLKSEDMKIKMSSR